MSVISFHSASRKRSLSVIARIKCAFVHHVYPYVR